jgi:hypothetical protein
MVRAMTKDRLPFLKTHIPPVLDYPIDPRKSVPFCQGLARMAYGHGVGERVQGVVQMLAVLVKGK